MKSSVGIDFGTTNSTVAVARDGNAHVARFPFMRGLVETFRSVLFFEEPAPHQPVPRPVAGSVAIERYLEPNEGGRLIQSLKSFAASRVFSRTQVGSRQYTLEELIGIFLKLLRSSVEETTGPLGNQAIAGRPVRFVSSTSDHDETLALDRLRCAYQIAGFDNVTFEYEPIGAAHAYAQRLSQDEIVLIADFGGGTSDFSIAELGPGGRHKLIATSGVPIGGDVFDARIVRHVVSPLLGLGTSYRSLEKTLPVPTSIYRKLEIWHHLSFLRTRDNLRLLQSIQKEAIEPRKIERLIGIVENDRGYHLHQSVQRTKVELSLHPRTIFSYSDASVQIDRVVERTDFETWIAADLRIIDKGVQEVLALGQLKPSQISRVFLTGGSSLVPAVQEIFRKFGSEKISAGDEFTSVAKGLALRGECL